MTDEPVSLKLAELAPLPEVVDTLRYWLAEAKSGRLRGVILLGVSERGSHMRSSKGEMGDANAVYLAQLVMADAIEDAKAREGEFVLPEPGNDEDE